MHGFAHWHHLADWRHFADWSHLAHFASKPAVVFGVGGLVVLIEIIWRVRFARVGYDGKAAAATLGLGVGNIVFGAANAIAIALVYALAWRFAPVRWPLSDWRTWVVGLFVVEFGYYWFHRWGHEVRWLWASHVVHHTPEQITLLSGLRVAWTNLFSGGWLVYVPVMLAGFDPRLVAAILVLDLHYQFFIHTEAKVHLGPLEWFLNTPAHHRLHHAVNPAYIDKNYGGMFIIFDRLFGTFVAEQPEETIKYGLVHPIGSHNPFALALGEWRRLLGDVRRAATLPAAFKAAFGRPG